MKSNPILSKTGRRQFLQSLSSVVLAPSLVASYKQQSRLPISFSTLGCPKWDWKTILDQASLLGYAAIELRGIQGELDLTKRPEFSSLSLKETLKDLKALDLRISDLGSSAHLHEFEPARRATQPEEGKRFIDLAYALRVPYVRVFGDRFIEGQSREATLGRVTEGLRELGEYAKSSHVKVILESHGDFLDSLTLIEIMKSTAMPNVGLLWDAYHTVVEGKEPPATTFKRLGQYVYHTHLKDSRLIGKEEQYVLTGTGSVPVRQTVQILAAGGYRGYYGFEWEKLWHPDIEEPEVAIPHFAKVMREYLAESGIKAE
jgi:sugar phosphate isomerase/epimerase